MRVFRYRNEPLRSMFGGGSVMVWGGIFLTATTGLHVVNYITDILEPHLPLILMQDNPKPCTARIVSGYLQDVGIQVMNWPARSPDLNPMEHLWNNMGKRLQEQMPLRVNEVRQRLVQICKYGKIREQ
jgi:hypothetical protein